MNWPSQLPAPLINTLRETSPDGTIRTQMDKGVDKVRRRTTANVRDLSFTLRLMPGQVDILDQFYIDVQALSFDYTHPRTGELVTARFASAPSFSERGLAVYDAQVNLEILP